ncbi:unnamed protein product [Schistosoma mattheei]|uniref:Uncharacterized protein n=1 Tax=Schistosoma mattheei TaxID=31246 RepID=A0A3P8KI29_9TREM|nr:unnamed protein product [Schistosoma mattheei]
MVTLIAAIVVGIHTWLSPTLTSTSIGLCFRRAA